jgi:hypothetical protein
MAARAPPPQGPFTKRFGNGALNILEAKVVTADGTILTTSKCSHPDLFSSIRGGGGGAAAVVVDFVARWPQAITLFCFHGPLYISAVILDRKQAGGGGG